MLQLSCSTEAALLGLIVIESDPVIFRLRVCIPGLATHIITLY